MTKSDSIASSKICHGEIAEMKVNLLEVATEVRQVERVSGFTRIWSPLNTLSATKAGSKITIEPFYVLYELQVELGDLATKASIELDFGGKKHSLSNITDSVNLGERSFQWCIFQGFSCDNCSNQTMTVTVELDGHILETKDIHISVQ